MRSTSYTIADVIADTNATPASVLIVSSEVMAVVHALKLELGSIRDTFPEPLPASGLVLCLPGMPIPPLPSGWAGVWARAESPPVGAWVPLPEVAVTDPQALEQALRAADAWRRERARFSQHTLDRAEALKAVNEIGIALSSERDPDRLLELILTRARRLVAADAGSLYLIKKGEKESRYLYFALAQNDSIIAPWKASVIPLNPHSVAGAVAMRGEVVVVDDVYTLPADGWLHHDQSFDQRFHYRTRSVVGIPLSTREGEILGVLPLIHRQVRADVPLAVPGAAEEVLPFSAADVELLRSLASQAAVSLENSRLYEDIQQLFEGFVYAAVTAIEQRDPTTSGHSFRVADGTLSLARHVERLDRGPWSGVRFSTEELRELRYAALLHDFGKVAVKENVLTKALKLFEDELATLQERFMLARASHRAGRLQDWLQEALRDPEGMRQRLPHLEVDLQRELADFDAMLQVVLHANQPNVTEAGDYSVLEAIRQRRFVDPDGQHRPLLTDREVQILSLRRGNLTPHERQEIEKHVTHSFNFLRTIPWTKDLARVPDLAGRHHEKLDGSGYPQGLAAADIPLGTRMMTIADIYDALVARDRPYKKALPLERALSILEAEAQAGKLDASLVQLWIAAKAWEDIGKFGNKDESAGGL
jgi:HD-GYP domain-containing protein (c-di-GMP phosphodiesterase class II)